MAELRKRPGTHGAESIPPLPATPALHAQRSTSPGAAKRAAHRLKHVAAHAAIGATVGGVVLGPVGIAIGLGKGIVLGTLLSHESVVGPAQQLGRSLEPDAVRELRIRASDEMARLRFRVDDLLAGRPSSRAPPKELARVLSGGAVYASPLTRASSADSLAALPGRNRHGGGCAGLGRGGSFSCGGGQ